MLDKLVIEIPFNSCWVHQTQSTDDWETGAPDPFARQGTYWVDPSYIPGKQGAKSVEWVNGEPVAEDLYCPWESLASSHGGLAVKCFDTGNGHCHWPYVVLKCSPAKLAQGHNVYGPDDMDWAIKNMLTLLNHYYPAFFGGYQDDGPAHPLLDFGKARVAEFDLTYSARVPNRQHRHGFMRLLHHLSKGQTKSKGDSYETSAYFGSKQSRLRKIKVYLKGPEVAHDNKERAKGRRDPIPDGIVALADELVRFEATIKRNWLDRRALPSGLWELAALLRNEPGHYTMMFGEVTKDLFEALEGQEVKVMSDKQVYASIERVHGATRGKTARVFGFYQSVRAVGLESLKEQYPDRTYRRMVRELEQAGFSRAVLCQLHEQDAEVIKLASVVDLSALGDPAPADYQPPYIPEYRAA